MNSKELMIHVHKLVRAVEEVVEEMVRDVEEKEEAEAVEEEAKEVIANQDVKVKEVNQDVAEEEDAARDAITLTELIRMIVDEEEVVVEDLELQTLNQAKAMQLSI